MTTTCCEDGPLQLRCQLCPQSPTYWRNCRICGTPVEPDTTGNIPAQHPNCTPEKGQPS